MKTSLGTRLYWSVMLMFAVFAVAFIIFQQHREKEFKIQTLNAELQDYNRQLLKERKNYPEKFPQIEEDMDVHRVTIIRGDGKVVYDNLVKNVDSLPNHADRREIKQALAVGWGYDINRMSSTMNRDYFYSATYFPHDKLIVRTAVPYDDNLAESLRADQHYIWFALGVMLVLSIILRRYTKRIDDNMMKLRVFAKRAAANESLETEELAQFSDDELGETAERIISIYKRVQETQQQQNELKKQLTQNIAHELRTPVASIQGYLETLINNPKVDEVSRARFLDRCHAQTIRLAALVEDISTLNRMDGVSERKNFREVDVAETVQFVVKETALQLEERGMKFVNQLPQNIIIQGDQRLIYSLFRNLTDNAMAYAGEGTTITLSGERRDDSWHFTFSDNGVGVSAEHLPRLFERFYRIDKGRSRKTGGTGLGLAIVKNAVKLHGGNITATNNPEGGLRFDFSLKA